jgi:hypothetical protein
MMEALQAQLVMLMDPPLLITVRMEALLLMIVMPAVLYKYLMKICLLHLMQKIPPVLSQRFHIDFIFYEFKLCSACLIRFSAEQSASGSLSTSRRSVVEILSRLKPSCSSASRASSAATRLLSGIS